MKRLTLAAALTLGAGLAFGAAGQIVDVNPSPDRQSVAITIEGPGYGVKLVQGVNEGSYEILEGARLAHVTVDFDTMKILIVDDRGEPTLVNIFGDPDFDKAAIFGDPDFDEAAIFGDPDFDEAAIFGDPDFDEAAIFGDPDFDKAAIFGDPDFDEAAILDRGEAGDNNPAAR